MRTIKVSDEVHEQLSVIKEKHGHTSFDSAIRQLVYIYNSTDRYLAIVCCTSDMRNELSPECPQCQTNRTFRRHVFSEFFNCEYCEIIFRYADGDKTIIADDPTYDKPHVSEATNPDPDSS